MSILTGGLAYKDRLGNALYTDYRNMLRVDALLHNPDIDKGLMWGQALVLLYGALEDTQGDYAALVNELVWFYTGGDQYDKSASGKKTPPLYDFDQDAEYLYSAFLECYKIDLTIAPEDDEEGLHWWRFLALFKALPDDTQMGKRVGYRSMDISKLKGSQRKEYERIKRAVAIKRSPAARQQLSLKERMERDYAEAERRLQEKNGI